MPFGPAAIGLATSVAAPLISGAIQGGLAGGGASASQGISRDVMNKGAANYTHDQGNYQPFIGAGQNALSGMSDLTGLNGADASAAALGRFQTSPGYGFAMQQGLQAVDHGAAANGMLRSGEILRSEMTLGQNLANQEFGNYFNRLSGIAGMGLQGASLGNQSTSTYDGLLTGTGGQQANTANQAGLNQASIYGNAINGAAGGITQGVKNNLFSTGVGTGTNVFDGAGVTASGFAF